LSVVVRETAYAKINLALHVRRRRADGYHELETVFAFCEHGDELSFELADEVSLSIEGPFGNGLSSDDNLILRAARSLGSDRGARITLVKNLPVASGVGGGSADAAATIRALSALWNVPIPSPETLLELGADVPGCLLSETRRGEGVGETLTAVESVAGIPVLLVNPRKPLSTGAVFAAWDGVDRGALGDWRDGRNDLSDAAIALVPEIADVLARLAAQRGVTVSRMSGSGATCFALFKTIADRDAACGAMPPEWWTMASRLR